MNLKKFARGIRANAKKNYKTNPWWERSADLEGINSKSIVVDIGGYTGEWAYRIAKKYNPYLYIFEPQEWCYPVLEEVFKYHKAKIFSFGLGTETGWFPVYNNKSDGCSFEQIIAGETRSSNSTLSMMEIGEIFKYIPLTDIDVMMINIEGGEFELIPHMLKQGILPKQLMFQCHDINKIHDLVQVVKEYYTNVWDYGTPLSLWRLNE